MRRSGRVAGKVAIVTGAARGIGYACALRLAEEGADIALLDIAATVQGTPYEGPTAEDLDRAANEIRALGVRALPLTVDVRNDEQLAEATAVTVRDLGAIDILVAAAGVDSKALGWELTSEQWETVIDVDLTGVWRSAKAVIPHMLPRESGSLVFIGSLLSHKPNRYASHYTAAKHGVKGLTRNLALELAPSSIRVNSVDPTAVKTEMIMNQAYIDRIVGRKGATVDDMIAWHREWNALPVPWLEPVDVANAVLFLASDEARYITGVSLLIDAGGALK